MPGSLPSTTINGLNLDTDVVRWSTPQANIIRAPKRFQSLSMVSLWCQYGCTMQGVDIADWFSNAVFTTTNHTIQGTVYARNAIIQHVEALGLVNNMTFNSQNLLLKNRPQRVNGNLIIGNRDANKFDPASMNSLTFDNLIVNSLNDRNVSEFFSNLILRNNTDACEVDTDLEFKDRLDIDDLIVTEQFNGTMLN